MKQTFDEFQRDCAYWYFKNALEQCNGSITKVAEIAGRERTHLYRLLKALGLNPANYRKPK